jgi:hypothetical protein
MAVFAAENSAAHIRTVMLRMIPLAKRFPDVNTVLSQTKESKDFNYN